LKILLPWYRYPPFDKTSVGGLSVAIWDLCNSIQDSKFSLEILCPQLDGPEEVIDSAGTVVLKNAVGTKLLHNRKLEGRDLEFLKGYDWIFSVNNFGARSISGIKEKVVRQIHTVAHDRPVSSYASLDGGFLEYLRMTIQRQREMSQESTLSGTRTICVSKYNLSKMIDRKLELETNLEHIPNGIDTLLFRPTGKEKKYDIIFIGRFQKLKGLDILLRAVSILQPKDKRPKLAIVGNFTDRQKEFCKRLVPSECRESLAFVGTIPHEQVPDLINGSKILVAPSRYESFSLPTLEAQACGIPVVATPVGGIPELLDQNTGILMKSIEDAKELAQAIDHALNDNSLQEKALKFGPARAKYCNLPTMSQRLKDFLSSVEAH